MFLSVFCHFKVCCFSGFLWSSSIQYLQGIDLSNVAVHRAIILLAGSLIILEINVKKIQKLWHYIGKYPQLTRFVLIGAGNTLVSFLIFVFFVKLLGENVYQVCLFLSWAVSSFFSFTLQKVFVFRTKGNWLKEYIKCLMTWTIGYGINAVSLGIIVHWFNYHVIIGQIIAIFLTTVSTFLLFKYFAFKKSWQADCYCTGMLIHCIESHVKAVFACSSHAGILLLRISIIILCY